MRSSASSRPASDSGEPGEHEAARRDLLPDLGRGREKRRGRGSPEGLRYAWRVSQRPSLLGRGAFAGEAETDRGKIGLSPAGGDDSVSDPKRPRARVLVVDDSATALTVLQVALEAAAFEVTTAADGLEALARIRDTPPDIIVTDSLMPRMDGYSFVRTLRAEPATRAIPVIMLTATDPADTTGRAADEQPDLVMPKSVAFERIVAEVEQLARRTADETRRGPVS